MIQSELNVPFREGLKRTIDLEVAVKEVRPSGRTNSVAWERPLGPEASGAEAHRMSSPNVGAKAPTS
jgi:hypothetical protein